MSVHFGGLLKQARLELGLTQEDVARETGVTRVSISMFERGTHEPVLKTALKLSTYLGISLDDLKDFSSIPADHEPVR